MKKLYVWYSSATNLTGKVIQELLGADGGVTKPAGNVDVLCWGTKTKKVTTFKGNKVYNHPDNIRTNRDKLVALTKMQKAGCNVAKFTANSVDIGKKDLAFPIIARTRFHQGGAGFWTCLNKDHIDQAIKEGAEYFQSYINVRTEYRLHIVNGEVVYAVKKMARDNLREAFVNYYKEHVENYAKKQNKMVDAPTLDLVLNRMARKMATSIDMTTRSNTRGWKFSKVLPNKLNKELKDEALKCVKTLGLDFGAVDCCLDDNNKAWVIECNTGPGLEGSSLKAWVTALKNLVAHKPEKVLADKVVKAGVAAKVAAPAKGKGLTAKERLKERTNMMAAMIDAADSEEEAAALEGIWKKMGI
ncbi:MAG: hypothetical protein PF437_03845 [Sulfurimonas sp.]|jgi:glutathione synthase/RimK-type ligase-like ATP-grasp enzyme|nr:hypothetical protein [Sulfurimonas sp.]